MKEIRTDFVVVGSGAGGATVAKELAEQGKKVLILEEGEEPSLIKRLHLKYNEGMFINSVCKKFKTLIGVDKNIPIEYRFGVGGTTTIASGNAARSLERELDSLGVSIEDELKEVEQELRLVPLPRNLIGKGAEKLREAANSLGLRMELVHKFVDFSKCNGCGKCCSCPTGAKWTAVSFLKKAQDSGASLLQNITVKEVLTSNGSVIGVKAKCPSGEMYIWANIVVLAAGAIGTSVILQKSGIESAGKKLFCDPYYFIYGPGKSDFYDWEPHAIIDLEFLRKDGFVLINSIVQESSGIMRYLPKFLKPEPERGLLGIMVKVKDDPIGSVSINGRIKKTMTFNDLCKLNKGVRIAKEILKKAGVDYRYIKIRGPGGAHPGGTAAIGEVVDQNQETEIKNLFVSDASVLPTSPGLPPMLTIIALAKRLSRVIHDREN